LSARDVVINLITKSDKKGLTDAEKGLDSIGKKAEKTGGIFSSIGSKLSAFGDNVGKDITGKLGPAGGAIDDVGGGLGDLSGKAGLAGAAIVGLGAVIGQGVGKLKELYDNTRNFNEVAGTSWEEGSRLIAVMDDLRVSADEGAGAMGKFTKTVGTSPGTLAQYGVEVARAKDGTVDMLGTLQNAATAFKNTEDPAKRAALGSALFGKSWQNIVPVLEQGGDGLRKLVEGVDKSQVATEKGAKQQNKMFEATDNLNDAVAGLQMRLAQDLLPTLITLAETGTEVVGIFGKVADAAKKITPDFDPDDEKKMAALRKNYNETAKEIFSLKELFTDFSVGDPEKTQRIADATKESADAHKLLLSSMVPTIPAAANLTAILESAEDAEKRLKVQAKEAGDEFKEFEKKTKDLLQAQEDLRDAQLGLEDSTLALEQAEIRAGDASFTLSEKTRETADAIRLHGESSTEAQVAVEEHRRAVVEARDALNGAAQAAVANAQQQAEASGQTLTAAERTKVYRDELVKLRTGVSDPALAAALDAQIDRLAAVAAQAQNAAANTHGLIQAMNDAAGIERNFAGRDSSGAAVTRRATGGPVWPGRTYMVGENGPELLNLPSGSGPGEVLSNPEMSRVGRFSGAFPTITTNADGTVMFAGDSTSYPGSVVKTGIPAAASKFPAVNTSVRRTTPTIPGYGPSGPSGSAAGAGTTIYITINGYADIKKLVEEIKKYEAARK
jgi:hypothetical protein